MNKFISLVFFISLVSCTKVSTKPSYQYLSAEQSKDGVVAKMGDIIITHEEMMSGIEMEVYSAKQKVFDIQNERIKSLLIEKLIAKDPRKGKMSNDEFLNKFILKGASVTPQAIEAFIKEKKIPAQHVNEQIKGRIKTFLLESTKKESIEKWLGEQTSSNPVSIYVNKPRRPQFNVVVGDAPFMGGKNAKVEIVEFSDFQCPYCSKGADLLKQIKKKYGKKVKVAFKHFPLPFHKQAQKAAEASMCAHAQKKESFWALHDKMFANQSKLDVKSLSDFAVGIGLDRKKFEECLSKDTFRARVESDIAEGKKLGVRSTPTFYVNGQLINGAQDISVFSELIDAGLK